MVLSIFLVTPLPIRCIFIVGQSLMADEKVTGRIALAYLLRPLWPGTCILPSAEMGITLTAAERLVLGVWMKMDT